MQHGSRLLLATVSCVLAVCCFGPAAARGQGPGHWGSRGPGNYVPDATGQPSYPPTYITTQGSVHLHLPQHRKPPCQRPASICFKPKMWKFSQVVYQLHHEVWHGVTDPCWLMDPDCCGTSCAHQKSFGLIDLFPWAKSADGRCGGASPCQQCGATMSGDGDYQEPGPARCHNCHPQGMPEAEEVEGEEITPTPAEPPVEHPQAARRGPLRSVLLRRE